MGGFSWVADNWPILLNAGGIVLGLCFNAWAIISETKTRRISNLLTLTQNHRETWSAFYRYPHLQRVLDPDADIQNQPIGVVEEIFVSSVILHLNASYHAIRDGLVVPPEGLQADITSFLNLPIPKAIWNSVKGTQDADFVNFVERNPMH